MTNFDISFENKIYKGKSWVIEKPKANVVIMEGMEEHLTRYDEFAKYLNANNFSVYGIDAISQGANILSDYSNRGVWNKGDFVKTINIYHSLITKLQREFFCPTYVFSHSMGSFMGQRYLELYPGSINKIVLCGSGCKNPAVGVGYLLARITTNKRNKNNMSHLIAGIMFGAFNKKIKNPKTPYDWLSYNEDNVKKYIDDPLCGYGSKKGFCLEFLRGLKPIHKYKELKKLDKQTSIFIISGEEDPVTSYSKAVDKLKTMYSKYGVNDVSTKIYTKMRHEILNEDSKDIVFNDVMSFFDK